MIIGYNILMEEQFVGLMNQAPTTEIMQRGFDESNPKIY